MHGQVVRIAGIYVSPHVGAHKEALVEEYALVLRLAVWSRALSVEVVEVKVLDVSRVRPAAKRPDEAMRHAGYAAEVNMTV